MNKLKNYFLIKQKENPRKMTNKGKRHTYKREAVIENIIKLRIEKGLTYLNILTFLMEQCKYSQSYSYELIKNAKTEINDRSIQLFGEDIKEDIERFENLYQSNLESNNNKEARECLKEIAKLKGHYVERMDIKVNDFKVTFPGINDK